MIFKNMKRGRPPKNSKGKDKTPKRRSRTLPAPEFNRNSTSNDSNYSDDSFVNSYDDVGRDEAVQDIEEPTGRVLRRQKRKAPIIRECPDCGTTREISSRGRCRPCYALYRYRCKQAEISTHKKCWECGQVRVVNSNRLCEICAKRIKRLRQGVDNRCSTCKRISKKMIGDDCLNCHRTVARNIALLEGNYKNCRQCNEWASCPNDGLCSDCSGETSPPQIIQLDQSSNESVQSADQTQPVPQPKLKYRHGVLLITSDEEDECAEPPRVQTAGKRTVKSTKRQPKPTSKSTSKTTRTTAKQSKNVASKQPKRKTNQSVTATRNSRTGIAQFLISIDSPSNQVIVQPSSSNIQATIRPQITMRVRLENRKDSIRQQQFYQRTPQSLFDQLAQPPVEVCNIIVNPRDKNVSMRRPQRPANRPSSFELTSTPINQELAEPQNIDDQPISPIQPQQKENYQRVQKGPSKQSATTRSPCTPVNQNISRLLRNWPNMFALPSTMEVNVSGPIESPPAAPSNTARARVEQNPEKTQPSRLKSEMQPDINYQNADSDIIAIGSQQNPAPTTVQQQTTNHESSIVEIDSDENSEVQIKVEPKIEVDYQNATDEVIAIESQMICAKTQQSRIFVPIARNQKKDDSIVEVSSDDENDTFLAFAAAVKTE